MDYLEVCCLFSKCLEIFLLSFCYWFIVLFHDGQRTYSVWFSLFLIYWTLFYGQGYVLFWRMFYGSLKKFVFCYCRVESFICANWVLLIFAVQIFYIFAHFLSFSSINCWERSVDFSSHNFGSISPFNHLSFLLNIIWGSVFDAYKLWVLLSPWQIDTFIIR